MVQVLRKDPKQAFVMINCQFVLKLTNQSLNRCTNHPLMLAKCVKLFCIIKIAYRIFCL